MKKSKETKKKERNDNKQRNRKEKVTDKQNSALKIGCRPAHD